MRLGKDALVFTKTQARWSLGFLSQTYLEKIKSSTIIVPFVTWDPKKFSILFCTCFSEYIIVVDNYDVFLAIRVILVLLELVRDPHLL